MPRPRWSADELAALAAIAPGDRSALDRFCRDFPGHTKMAVRSKLAVLRQRRQAVDVATKPADLRIKPRPAAAWPHTSD